MTKEEYRNLLPNQRVVLYYFNEDFVPDSKEGYVMKAYRNYQVKVWFDGEIKPRVVGYTQIELPDDQYLDEKIKAATPNWKGVDADQFIKNIRE
jgi:hypothetical protein